MTSSKAKPAKLRRSTPVKALPMTPEEFFRAWSRKDKESLIEVLITSLDHADGDPDDEPSLGAPEIREYHGRRGYAWARGSADDREDCPDEENDRVDDEPSIGATSSIDQALWAIGGSLDLEDEHDGAEPSLGWTYKEAVHGRTYAGSLGGCFDLEDNACDMRQLDEAETGIADAEGLMEQTGRGGGCSGTGFAVTVE